MDAIDFITLDFITDSSVCIYRNNESIKGIPYKSNSPPKYLLKFFDIIKSLKNKKEFVRRAEWKDRVEIFFKFDEEETIIHYHVTYQVIWQQFDCNFSKEYDSYVSVEKKVEKGGVN